MQAKRFTPLLTLCAALTTFGCQYGHEQTAGLQYYSAPGTEGLELPFSAAVRAGNTIYLSGNIGNLPGKLQLVEGGIGAETRQTLDNIRTTVEAAGSTMENIVKCTVFMADMSEWAAMNEVYRTYFKRPPARSALGANGLALDARVEIECIAVAS